MVKGFHQGQPRPWRLPLIPTLTGSFSMSSHLQET